MQKTDKFDSLAHESKPDILSLRNVREQMRQVFGQTKQEEKNPKERIL